jgi:hypothetical protein
MEFVEKLVNNKFLWLFVGLLNLSGAVVTGNTGAFTVISGISGRFTNLSGTTITGNIVNATTGTFTVLNATTVNFTSTATGNIAASGSGIFGSGLLTSGSLFVSGSGTIASGLNVGGDLVVSGSGIFGSGLVTSGALFVSGNSTLASGLFVGSDIVGSGSAIFSSGLTASGNLFVSGSGIFGSGILSSGVIGTTSGVRWFDADESNWVQFVSPVDVPVDTTWILPSGDATISGYALISDASGNLSWGEAGGGGATGGGTDEVFYENDQAVTTSYTITTGKNAMTAGPIAINSGVVVTVPSGSDWIIV